MNFRFLGFLLVSLFVSNATFAVYYNPTPAKGTIYRMYVQYVDSDTVQVTPGYCEANSKYYEVAEDTDYDLGSIPYGEDYVYLYIDDSASSAPSITFTDSTTEPSWDDDKLGWYNGDDRCVGALYTEADTSTIHEFFSVGCKYHWAYRVWIEHPATGVTGGWQDTATNINPLTPVVAKAVMIDAATCDADGGNISMNIMAKSGGTRIFHGGYKFVKTSTWIDTGTDDRNIQYIGDPNADYINIGLYGYEIDR